MSQSTGPCAFEVMCGEERRLSDRAARDCDRLPRVTPDPAGHVAQDSQRNGRAGHDQQHHHTGERETGDEQERQGNDRREEDGVEQAEPDGAAVQVRSASPEHASIPPQNDVTFVASYIALINENTRFWVPANYGIYLNFSQFTPLRPAPFPNATRSRVRASQRPAA